MYSVKQFGECCIMSLSVSLYLEICFVLLIMQYIYVSLILNFKEKNYKNTANQFSQSVRHFYQNQTNRSIYLCFFLSGPDSAVSSI